MAADRPTLEFQPDVVTPGGNVVNYPAPMTDAEIRDLQALAEHMQSVRDQIRSKKTMRKRDELTDPASCMSRARDDEMTFVLLGRDTAAPVVIRAWIGERLRLGKNKPDDPQIEEAEQCARTMELQRVEASP